LNPVTGAAVSGWELSFHDTSNDSGTPASARTATGGIGCVPFSRASSVSVAVLVPTAFDALTANRYSSIGIKPSCTVKATAQQLVRLGHVELPATRPTRAVTRYVTSDAVSKSTGGVNATVIAVDVLVADADCGGPGADASGVPVTVAGLDTPEHDIA
jgi:hypothetical protein